MTTPSRDVPGSRSVGALLRRALVVGVPLIGTLLLASCSPDAAPGSGTANGAPGGGIGGGAPDGVPDPLGSGGALVGGGGAAGNEAAGAYANGGGSGGSGAAGFTTSSGGATGSGGALGAGGLGMGIAGGAGATSGGSFSPPPDGNPFTGADLYVNADYAAEIQTSIDAASGDPALLEKAKAYPTAIWLDRIARVASVGTHLDRALAAQQSGGKPVVTVFVVYDLPNRDCAAKASNGELSVDSGGLQAYESQFVDAIHAEFASHASQRIVAIVEPDSLPNITTNLSQPKCAASEQAYRDGVAYAIRTLSAPNVFLYLDAAHSGWLGWPNNQSGAATVFRQVLDAAGGQEKIRGFATNVANYSVLHETAELFDYQGNPCHDELTFVSQLSGALSAVGITGKGFIVDTSRNGRGGIRHAWGNWCNVTGAGFGERPQASPAPGLDAYFWVKPPGESDGTSDTTSPRYDSFCGNEDAAKPAPEAGSWFGSYFVETAKNASPPL